MTIPILDPFRDWYCPQCKMTARLAPPAPRQAHMHTCPQLRMLSTPLYPAGLAVKVELREREDYVGTEKVRLDPERKRPVMAMVTTRDDGNDVRVYAPTATGSTR